VFLAKKSFWHFLPPPHIFGRPKRLAAGAFAFFGGVGWGGKWEKQNRGGGEGAGRRILVDSGALGIFVGCFLRPGRRGCGPKGAGRGVFVDFGGGADGL